MNDSLRSACVDALALLETIDAATTTPDLAQQRLRTLASRHPGIPLELVWEEEAHDGSFHYDVLVRGPDGVTVSLAVCRDRALPWPLRGVRRFHEANLLQVNGRMMTVEHAVELLDVLWNEAPLMQRMIDACLIRQELDQRSIEISDDELQRGFDGVRRAHRLFTAEATERWMRERGMTHDRLEQLVHNQLACARLREQVARVRIDEYFEAHRDELEAAWIVNVTCDDEQVARETATRLTHDGSAALATLPHALAAGSQTGRAEIVMRRRRELCEELDASFVAARAGDVVGPLERSGGHLVVRILATEAARLDEPTRALIQQILFDEWLAERRAAATITWHWGRAAVAERDRMPACG